jgi:hypothetical protein
MQAPSKTPSKTYFAVLGNFDDKNIPRGKIYSTSTLDVSTFFDQIANNQISADIQIDDLYEEEEEESTPASKQESSSEPIVVPERKAASPPPIPQASKSKSPHPQTEHNTIPKLPHLTKREKKHAEDTKRAQESVNSENLPAGKLIQLPEEEIKVVPGEQSKYIPVNIEKQIQHLINKSKRDPTGNTDGVNSLLSKIAKVEDNPQQTKLFESFIQKLYNTKIDSTNESLYNFYKSDIVKYSSYKPVKPTEQQIPRVVPVKPKKSPTQT